MEDIIYPFSRDFGIGVAASISATVSRGEGAQIDLHSLATDLSWYDPSSHSSVPVHSR
jgi:hypothetical protein